MLIQNHWGYLAGAIHQGGGLVNAFCAVFSNTSVSTSSIALNDSSNFQYSHTFSITNKGLQPVSYRVQHLPAGSISPFSAQSKHGRIDSKIPTPSQNYASVQIQPETFTLMPGNTQVVRARFSPPVGLDPKYLYVYSGYISLVGLQILGEINFHSFLTQMVWTFFRPVMLPANPTTCHTMEY